MRIGVLLSVCLVATGSAASACKGPQVTYAPDASPPEAGATGSDDAGSSGSGAGGACNVPKNSNSAPVGSCLSAVRFVDCSFDSGAGLGCLSNGAITCTGAEGAECVSKCAGNQYAVSCGGPTDGGVTYEAVPANCKVVANTPGGKAYACCSCDGAQ